MSKFFRKKFRWDADVANELSSCRQFVGGSAPRENDKFVVEVLNKAIRYALHNHSFFKSATEIDEADRTYGKVIDLKISRENWLGVQVVIDQMRAMSESDLMQFAVKHYLEVVKARRALPEDAEYQLDGTVDQIRT